MEVSAAGTGHRNRGTAHAEITLRATNTDSNSTLATRPGHFSALGMRRIYTRVGNPLQLERYESANGGPAVGPTLNEIGFGWIEAKGRWPRTALYQRACELA